MLRSFLIALLMVGGCLSSARSQGQNDTALFPQLGHSEVVTSLAFSPDGKLLVSGSLDATVKLWDMTSGRELRTLTGHANDVQCVAFSPDGKLVASGSGAIRAGIFAVHENAVKVWNVADGRELFTLSGHTQPVAKVAFSPDGKTLASASGDGTVKLWDVATGRELRTLSGHSNVVFALAYSPDGRTLATGSYDNTIKLWDAASGSELATLTGHNKGVKAIAFSPDGRILASGGGDALVKLWDVAHRRVLRTLTGHSDEITSLVFTPDRRMVVSASVDRTIKVWDATSGRILNTLTGHRGPVSSIAFSPDGRLFASGSADTTIEIWDFKNRRGLRNLGRHTWAIRSLAASSDGTIVASGNANDMIELWDLSTGRVVRSLDGHIPEGSPGGPFYYEVHALAFSPDGNILASARGDKTIKLWELASGHSVETLSGHSDFIRSIAFSPDGKVLASGSLDHTVKLWDIANGSVRATLAGHTSEVSSVVFSPDGRILASASDDYTIKLWDVATGTLLHTLTGHSAAVYAVAFSPDGKLLASGAGDNTVKLWNVADGSQRLTLTGHLRGVNSVAFAPDGKTLASGSRDATIKIWSTANWRELRTLNASTIVWGFRYVLGGRVITSYHDDGTIRVWDASSGRQRVALMSFFDGASHGYSHLAITPEGYFYSSSAFADQLLNVRIGNRVFGIDSYREKFYRPDLVKLSMAGASLSQLGSVGDEKLPPFVELADLPLTTTDPTLHLTLRLVDGGGGIGLVRVFLNGSAVIQDDAASGPLIRSYPVQLLDGPNELRVVAFNADGSVQSNSVSAEVTAHLPRPVRGTLHAVIVGIQEFPKRPQNNLTYPVADAQLFADTLKQYSAPLFENLDIKVLTTAAETDRDHIVQALTAMQSAAGPDDEFVFYVASHGLVVDGEYYLITSNVSSSDTIKSEAISRRQLASLLANIHAPKKLVIIDTCHAQPIGDALQQALQSGGMTDATATTILSRQIGSTVLAAATTDQEALEGYKDHGLFTRVIADGIGGRAAINGLVSNFSLADYVGAEVPPLANNIYRHEQTPTINANGQRFLIAEVK